MPEIKETTNKKNSYFKSMALELKKVVWPTKDQTAKGTGTVILFALLITLILVLLNFGFEFLNRQYWNLVK